MLLRPSEPLLAPGPDPRSLRTKQFANCFLAVLERFPGDAPATGHRADAVVLESTVYYFVQWDVLYWKLGDVQAACRSIAHDMPGELDAVQKVCVSCPSILRELRLLEHDEGTCEVNVWGTLFDVDCLSGCSGACEMIVVAFDRGNANVYESHDVPCRAKRATK